jgi:peroxiredoxin
MTTAFYVSYGALWVLVLVQTVLLILVYRHFGMMTLGTIEGVQRDGLAVGEKAPSIYGVTREGKDFLWAPSERSSVIIFASPDCSPCAVVLPAAERLSTMRAKDLEVVAVVPGPADSAARTADDYRISFTCIGEDGSGAFDSYKVRVTPFAFVVGNDGLVRSKGLCSDPLMLRDLLESAGLVDSATVVSQPIRAATNGAGKVEVTEGAE